MRLAVGEQRLSSPRWPANDTDSDPMHSIRQTFSEGGDCASHRLESSRSLVVISRFYLTDLCKGGALGIDDSHQLVPGINEGFGPFYLEP